MTKSKESLCESRWGDHAGLRYKGGSLNGVMTRSRPLRTRRPLWLMFKSAGAMRRCGVRTKTLRGSQRFNSESKSERGAYYMQMSCKARPNESLWIQRSE
jgi:hypothetical protein